MQTLLDELRQALREKPYAGVWDAEGVEVHVHPPPFCWGRDARHDCTRRAVEALRAGLSIGALARRAGMDYRRLAQVLALRGIEYQGTGLAKVLSPRARGLLNRASEFATLTSLARLMSAELGRPISITTVHGLVGGVKERRTGVGPSLVKLTLTLPAQTAILAEKAIERVGMRGPRGWQKLIQLGTEVLEQAGREEGLESGPEEEENGGLPSLGPADDGGTQTQGESGT